MDNFKPQQFFDLEDFEYKDIFEGIESVWEIIPKLESFIKSLFDKDRLKANKGEYVFVHPDALVDETARIIGPAIILEGAEIGFSTLIRKNSIIGKGVKVGHASEVKNSIVLNNSSLPHFNYIGDSLIGNNVNIGGGAKTANLRLDKQKVTVRINENTKIETDLVKFGAIIGDGSQIGVNAVTNPGTVLGKNCKVYSLVSVKGVYPKDSIIKN